MRKFLLVFSVLFAGLFLGSFLTLFITQPRGSMMSAGKAASSETYKFLNLFGDVFERVRVDAYERPDDTKLIEGAISGMLQAVDPRSAYLNAVEFRDIQVTSRGGFGTIGAETTMAGGLLRIVSPVDDTPAARAGLRAGDVITHIDNDAVAGLALSQAVEKMRGPANSVLRLKVMRWGSDRPLDFNITREVVRVRSVRSRVEDGDIGYIKISTFNEITTEGLKREIATLQSQVGDTLKGFIVDLRNNPGGLLEEAITVSDAFLEKGLIVETRGRNAEESLRRTAHAGDLTRGKPVVVLINGGSAGASEIVAGALQHHKRAKVVGSLSFGHGSVQTIVPLGSGHGALRLTTAVYYTPAGAAIQRYGITPDLVVEQKEPPLADLRADQCAQMIDAAFKTSANSQPALASFVPAAQRDDTALLRAIEVIRGKV